MRLADFVAQFFAEHGITHVYMVTGGGAMHLNDAIGREKRFQYICCHHEQACSMAAEGAFRVSGRPALVNVTTGPGGINAINGVHGAYTDSIAMIVLSGQVKRETMASLSGIPLRQLGDQEADIIPMVKGVTKYAVCVTDPQTILYHLEKSLFLATNGRPGPVWIDIPIDVQSTQIKPDELIGFNPLFEPEHQINHGFNQENLRKQARKVISLLQKAERPVLMPGSGIRTSGTFELFQKIINRLGIGIAPAFNAHDLIAENNPLYVGRPGTIGNRAGNFAVQNSDLLIVLGCRLNIRQISYNWHSFAKHAFKIMVDVDKLELIKHTLKIDLPIHADLKDFLNVLDEELINYQYSEQHKSYISWCQERRQRYPVVLPEYWEASESVNPYCFMQSLFRQTISADVVVAANATACITSFQAGEINEGVRLFSNSGSASMGYDLPAAIGAATNNPYGRTICLAGDGSLMMNMQELQTIITHQLPIKIFLLNNDGYHSIRQTQKNYFPNSPIGYDPTCGVMFPNFIKIAQAFGYETQSIHNNEQLNSVIYYVLNRSGPQFCVVHLDKEQTFSPKLASRMQDDGSMSTPALEDMAPFLPIDELHQNLI
jgi:acetolactate synthase-1/2/3 large subunit